MRTLDFSPYVRSTIGFDQLFDMLERTSDTGNGGYPPYNIERSDETHYRISLAVADLPKKDLNIEVRDGVLTVAGKAEQTGKPTYLHQGIAAREFDRQFQLAEHVEVRAAKLENGLLHIDLEKVIPEEKKPRRILINATELKTIEGNAKAA